MVGTWGAQLAGPPGSPRRAWLKRGVHGLLMLLIGGFLVYRLNSLGWATVLASLPDEILFYLLLPLRYAVLPTAEMLIYGGFLGKPLWRHAPIFLRKRILNFDVVPYSGEAYFVFWLRSRFGWSTVRGLRTVKDVNLLSGAVTNSATFLFLMALLLEGSLIRMEIEKLAWGAGAMALICGGLVGSLILFRTTLLSAAAGDIQRTVLIHAARFVTAFLLYLTIFATALPQVPPGAWLLLLAVHMVINNLPLLPSKDLMFFAAALPLAGAINVPEADLAGLLLAYTVVQQMMNLALLAFLGTGGGQDRDHPVRGSGALSPLEPASKPAGP